MRRAAIHTRIHVFIHAYMSIQAPESRFRFFILGSFKRVLKHVYAIESQLPAKQTQVPLVKLAVETCHGF